MMQYPLLQGPSDKCHSRALQGGKDAHRALTGWQKCTSLVAFGQRHHMCVIITASKPTARPFPHNKHSQAACQSFRFLFQSKPRLL